MKNLFKVKTILGMVGIIAFVAAIGFSFSACDNGTTGGDDDGGNSVSKTITITIQNTTDEDDAVKIDGVKVYVQGSSANDPEIYKIGDANTFDTSHTVEAGASVTLPDFELKIDTEGVNQEPFVNVHVSYGEGKERGFSKRFFSTTAETLNLEFAYNFSPNTDGYRLKE